LRLIDAQVKGQRSILLSGHKILFLLCDYNFLSNHFRSS
jgi:hypothetical protein